LGSLERCEFLHELGGQHYRSVGVRGFRLSEQQASLGALQRSDDANDTLL
jgi:hypothetical protein